LVYQKWHVLRLKEDFMTTLRENGALPISSFKTKLEITEEKLKDEEVNKRQGELEQQLKEQR